MDNIVEVVIRLPKDDFNYIWCQGDTRGTPHLAEAIKNGTVLPKGHGRLIEADRLIPHLQAHNDLLIRHYADQALNIPLEINSRIDQIRICMSDIDDAPTVIEADREEQDEK